MSYGQDEICISVTSSPLLWNSWVLFLFSIFYRLRWYLPCDWIHITKVFCERDSLKRGKPKYVWTAYWCLYNQSNSARKYFIILCLVYLFNSVIQVDRNVIGFFFYGIFFLRYTIFECTRWFPIILKNKEIFEYFSNFCYINVCMIHLRATSVSLDPSVFKRSLLFEELISQILYYHYGSRLYRLTDKTATNWKQLLIMQLY